MRNNAIFSYAKDNYQKFFNTINNKNYLFRATLVNADGVVVDLQKSAIKELYLKNILYEPFVSGYMIVNNTDNVIERYKTDQVNKELEQSVGERGYKVRGDGRDLVLISIIPVELPNNPYDEQSTEYNKVFGFQYAFILGNEEDVTTNTGQFKKYTLIDLDEIVLKEKKIFFSTIELINKVDISSLTDVQREALTGDCMKAILRKGLNDSTAIQTILSGGEELTPNFESGISKVFYSSPNDYTALDDLMTMYDYHVSNDPGKDFSFLTKDEYTGEYSLESASSLFKKAYNKSNDSGGFYYIENITITGGEDESNVLQNDLKKPLKALEFGETGDVIDVKFYNTPGVAHQNKINTRLVHSYSFTDKSFYVDCVDGNVENVKKDFSKLYVEPMKGKDNKPSPNFIINNTQKTNQNFQNDFLIYSEDNEFLKLAVGRNKLLKDALNLNLGVEILVQGGFQRKAGRFISIDRVGNYIDNDFDNKFLGIYFIVSVEHMFINDTQYYNKIIAVKTYHFTDPKINEDIP